MLVTRHKWLIRTHSHSPLSPPKMGVGRLFEIDLTDYSSHKVSGSVDASNGKLSLRIVGKSPKILRPTGLPGAIRSDFAPDISLLTAAQGFREVLFISAFRCRKPPTIKTGRRLIPCTFPCFTGNGPWKGGWAESRSRPRDAYRAPRTLLLRGKPCSVRRTMLSVAGTGREGIDGIGSLPSV